MLTQDFWFDLPPDRIAQNPVTPRDSSKLMVLDTKNRSIQHKFFHDLTDFLDKGDILVVNDSKVFKARLEAHKPGQIGKIQIFLLRPDGQNWHALAKPAKKLSDGDVLIFADNYTATVINKLEDGEIVIDFNLPVNQVMTLADRLGQVPLPPYIKNSVSDAADYQTVYAKNTGSVAAPTAGFHFTPGLIDKLEQKGVIITTVTLHVGLGTFRPITSEKLEDHKMHSEWFEIPQSTLDTIKLAKQNNKRVIAVGTTSARTLESLDKIDSSSSHNLKGSTNIFIKPGYTFKNIDGMITNFHLPASTLIVLISALVGYKLKNPDEGRRFVLDAYRQAIKNNYRFYSFGDAMFIN